MCCATEEEQLRLLKLLRKMTVTMAEAEQRLMYQQVCGGARIVGCDGVVLRLHLK